jgi:hypothetical protein
VSINDFQILRIKGPNDPADVDSNDPDWFATQIDPNSTYYTVGGTADDGTYSLTFTKLGQATGVTVGIVADATGGDTNSDIAAALEAELQTEAAAGGTIHEFVKDVTVASAILTLTLNQTSFGFTITAAAPGTGTLTPIGTGEGTGTLWQITAVIPFDRRIQYGPNTDVEITLVCLDSNGVVLDPAGTYNLEIVEGIDVPKVRGVIDAVEAVATRGEIAGSFGEIHSVQLNGSKQFGVRLSSIANEPVGTDRIVVLYRAVVA